MKKFLKLAVSAVMLLPMIATAHGPSRQQVVEKITINAAPEKVWEVVGDFGGLHKWHPMIADTKLEGEKVRVLTVDAEGSPTITEDLKQLDDGKMMIKYKIKAMDNVKQVEYKGATYDVPAVPVSNYLSFIKVAPVDGGSEVTWTGKFYRVYQLNYDKTEPRYPEGLGDEDAVAVVTEIYKAGLTNLKEMLEGK